MGNAAILLKNQGHVINGSDQNIYAPMSDALKEFKIEYYENFNINNLKHFSPNLVVVAECNKQKSRNRMVTTIRSLYHLFL